MQVTLGGERLGSGKKNKIYMREYERSTHDLSFVWRSTMSSGTLVPFMSQVAMPGDTFDIDLDVDVITHPTIGPLFGTYKVQLDVFQLPIRLYQAMLHMNMTGIGMKMNEVRLPMVALKGYYQEAITTNLQNSQINPSSIFKYLGISGVGTRGGSGIVRREFNAVPWLGYWDIYKNYYANKQEEIGMVLHTNPTVTTPNLLEAYRVNAQGTESIPVPPEDIQFTDIFEVTPDWKIIINGTGLLPEQIKVITQDESAQIVEVYLTQMFLTFSGGYNSALICSNPTINSSRWPGIRNNLLSIGKLYGVAAVKQGINVSQFELANIDKMRLNILKAGDGNIIIENTDVTLQAPYNMALQANVNDFAIKYSQEGLGLKTYNSDLFNNWLSTEWIDGADGISEITAISTAGGSFTIDELNLSSKIYVMLNRIAISGGTYDDWLDAVYTHERPRSAENPIYLGGAIRNLVFQEVISNAEASGQPLGTLAGKGRLGGLRKGGKIVAKIDEPSYIMGIVSLTPMVDYSQGNQWDVNLKTMDDFHKPALDEIGFQDLITDQMAWWDTRIPSGTGVPQYKSAGKQPAWINYMTNVNKVYGEFADDDQMQFMVLDRRYEPEWQFESQPTIWDLTTYIDPSKFNHIFADTALDAQNFWTQIRVGIEARRKMSAKVIPNL